MIPAMTPEKVHNYMRYIGRTWTGQGVAIEVGSWFGASAVPLLEGLVQAGYDKPFFAYDKWMTNEDEARKARKQGYNVNPRQNILPLFLKNTQKVYKDIRPVQGYVSSTIGDYNHYPIEICIFDAPKIQKDFDTCVKALYPYWIPGVTVLGLLDYWKEDKEKVMASKDFIESNEGCFEKLTDWPQDCSCAFFRYVKPLN